MDCPEGTDEEDCDEKSGYTIVVESESEIQSESESESGVVKVTDAVIVKPTQPSAGRQVTAMPCSEDGMTCALSGHCVPREKICDHFFDCKGTFCLNNSV